MNILFASAAAEEAAGLSEILEGTTPEEALAVGSVLGAAAGFFIALGIVYFVLRAVADWKIFAKAGVSGWKALIPFLADYEEYKLCWKGSIGLCAAVMLAVVNHFSGGRSDPETLIDVITFVLGILALVLSCMESLRLARAFGKSRRFGVGLFLLGPIFRLILGFGSARYLGHPDGR